MGDLDSARLDGFLAFECKPGSGTIQARYAYFLHFSQDKISISSPESCWLSFAAMIETTLRRDRTSQGRTNDHQSCRTSTKARPDDQSCQSGAMVHFSTLDLDCEVTLGVTLEGKLVPNVHLETNEPLLLCNLLCSATLYFHAKNMLTR